ncbi:protein tweety homolog 1 isoform X5 [Dermochelys coriacea]|uniref:protein tweety homolog 1 isoform X5 n=1 Tax=Dermochelys coriacea TaxID=27794 RepID=UPI001CA933BE|nr:protein tweety homolog 1 isoform X5 [Dermochelys coriacea]XP_043357135.1 protein tweety homolog 1 isoform X5 [Dermochelys coriacea]
MGSRQGYQASWWVYLLHQVPRTNFQFEAVESSFAPLDREYQQALLLLTSVAGLCLAISLGLICVYLIRFCCCDPEDEDEPKPQRVCCVTWSCVAAIVICCAGIGLGFYGNSETNDGVGQVTAALQDANLTLQSADALVRQTLGLLSGAVGGDLTRLEEALAPRTEFVAVVRNTRRQAEAVAQILAGLPFWGALGGSPSQLAHGLAYLEDYRWLAYILVLLLDLVICLFTLLGLAKQIKWLVVVMTVMSFFVLILSWGSLGLEMAAAVGLSDFCSDPDGFVLNLTQAKTDLNPAEILQYYLACSLDVPNPFQQRLTMSQRALSSIHSQLHGLEREAIPQFPAAERNLVSVQVTLNTTESNFHQLVALLNCRGLHKDYVDALKGLCYDGMEGLLFLLLFSLLSALAFTTAICSLPRAWERFQSRDAAYEDTEDDDPFTPQESKRFVQWQSSI